MIDAAAQGVDEAPGVAGGPVAPERRAGRGKTIAEEPRLVMVAGDDRGFPAPYAGLPRDWPLRHFLDAVAPASRRKVAEQLRRVAGLTEVEYESYPWHELGEGRLEAMRDLLPLARVGPAGFGAAPGRYPYGPLAIIRGVAYAARGWGRSPPERWEAAKTLEYVRHSAAKETGPRVATLAP